MKQNQESMTNLLESSFLYPTPPSSAFSDNYSFYPASFFSFTLPPVPLLQPSSSEASTTTHGQSYSRLRILCMKLHGGRSPTCRHCQLLQVVRKYQNILIMLLIKAIKKTNSIWFAKGLQIHINIFIFPYLNFDYIFSNMEIFYFEYCIIENMYCFQYILENICDIS